MTTTITEEGGDPASTIVMPAVGGEPETQPEVQVQPKQTPPVQHQCHVFGFYSYFQHQ